MGTHYGGDRGKDGHARHLPVTGEHVEGLREVGHRPGQALHLLHRWQPSLLPLRKRRAHSAAAVEPAGNGDGEVKPSKAASSLHPAPTLPCQVEGLADRRPRSSADERGPHKPCRCYRWALISSVSGKRPSSNLEKTSSPSTVTSNRPPSAGTIAHLEMSIFFSLRISSAKLTALGR